MTQQPKTTVRDRLQGVSWAMVAAVVFAVLGFLIAATDVWVDEVRHDLGAAALTCALISIAASITSYREG